MTSLLSEREGLAAPHLAPRLVRPSDHSPLLVLRLLLGARSLHDGTLVAGVQAPTNTDDNRSFGRHRTQRVPVPTSAVSLS